MTLQQKIQLAEDRVVKDMFLEALRAVTGHEYSYNESVDTLELLDLAGFIRVHTVSEHVKSGEASFVCDVPVKTIRDLIVTQEFDDKKLLETFAHGVVARAKKIVEAHR